jgi:putative addiction module CopG family antidote
MTASPWTSSGFVKRGCRRNAISGTSVGLLGKNRGSLSTESCARLIVRFIRMDNDTGEEWIVWLMRRIRTEIGARRQPSEHPRNVVPTRRVSVDETAHRFPVTIELKNLEQDPFTEVASDRLVEGVFDRWDDGSILDHGGLSKRSLSDQARGRTEYTPGSHPADGKHAINCPYAPSGLMAKDHMMTVQIAPDVEAKIRDKVETGSYTDINAVLREAMALLEERDRKHAWLLEALAEGEKGEAIEFTPERMEEIRQRAHQNVRQLSGRLELTPDAEVHNR